MHAPASRIPAPDSRTELVNLSDRTIRLACYGLQRYRPFLEDMSGLASLFQLETSPVKYEIEALDRVVHWCKERASVNEDGGHVHSLNYGTLRWLKTGLLLASRDFKRERTVQFSKHPALPVSLVEAINSKIGLCENLAETGIFNGMEPIRLIADLVTPADVRVEVVAPSDRKEAGPASFRMRVELLDPELRRRCGDLYEQFASDAAHQDRFDTVLRESSALIEGRIRARAELPATLIGEALLAKALAPNTGELIFSTVEKEQRSIHALFIGFFGFVRNSVSHGLIATYTQERAAQILGLADYLLFVLSTASRRTGAGTVGDSSS
jgi:Protein of unknown function (Hypoth_ymh)